MKFFIHKTKTKIVEKSILVWDKTKSIGRAFKREAHETKGAFRILKKVVTRKEVTPEEIKFLKNQSADLGKSVVIISLKVIPGAFLAILGLEKVAQKYGLTLFPQEHVIPGHTKYDDLQKSISPGNENDVTDKNP